MLTFCELHPWKQIWVKVEQIMVTFYGLIMCSGRICGATEIMARFKCQGLFYLQTMIMSKEHPFWHLWMSVPQMIYSNASFLLRNHYFDIMLINLDERYVP